jgi:membrane-bound serine protease (ClpP class)
MAAIGISLISLEVIVPGGILGALGSICLLVGCVLSFVEFGAMGGLLGSAIILSLTAIILWLEFKLLSKTPLGRRAFLTKSVDGSSATYGAEAQLLIGKPAVAQTTLSPSGYIAIDGKRYEGFCQSGLIKAGTALKVVGADSFRLIVTPESPTSPDNPQ